MTRSLPASPVRSSTQGTLIALTRTELLKLVRMPAFMIPTLLFPTMFFAMFGLSNANRVLEGVNAGQYMVVSYAAYALMSVALFSFGVSVAAERGLGWSRMLRVTPLPPTLYFIAKILSAMLIGLATVLILIAFAVLAGGVRFEPVTLTLMVLRLLAGMTPFVALGLLIGYASGPNSAAPIANVIFLPMAFASGLFIPVEVGPKALQLIAPYMPGYHFARLGWGAIGAEGGADMLTHGAWLAGYSAVFLALAVWTYRRDEGQKYG